MNLELKPRKLVQLLTAATAMLVVLHIISCLPMFIADRAYPLGFFSLDGENNLPAMFSTALLWLNALLAGWIAWASWGERRDRLYWLGLALVFLAMGLDESTMLHERLVNIGREQLGASGIFYYAWVIPYMIALILFVLVYARFFFRLPVETRKRIMLASVLYVSGAVGIEMLGGSCADTLGKGALYYLLSTIEETLEMAGCIVFTHAFTSHIAQYLPECRIHIVRN